MPGLGAEETFAGLRRVAPRLPIVLSSGYAEAQASQDLLGQEAVSYLEKPFTSTQLADCLRALRRTQRV